MSLIMFCLKYILQLQNISIGFRDTRDSENSGICKHEPLFTYCGYCRFTLTLLHCQNKLRKLCV